MVSSLMITVLSVISIYLSFRLTLGVPTKNSEHGVTSTQTIRSLLQKSSSRLFYANNSGGEMFYMAVNQSNDSCPSRDIVHTELRPAQFIPNSYYVPHTKILAGGQRCGNGSQLDVMLMVPGNLITDPQTAALANASDVYTAVTSVPRFLNGYNKLSSVDPIYLGVELTNDRVCGGIVHWTKGSVFIFLNAENKNFNFNQYGFVNDGEDAMVSYKLVSPNPLLCVYKNSIIPGPNISPLPTPSEIPSAAPSSSPNAYGGVAVLQAAPVPSPSQGMTANPQSNGSVPAGPSPIASQAAASSPGSSGNGNSGPTSTVATLPASTSSFDTASVATSAAAPTKTDSVVFPAGSPGSSPEANSSKGACFPAAARVEVEGGRYIRIEELKVGDRVRVGPEAFSDVFMFTHKILHSRSKFIRIEVASGDSLALSPGHYLYVNGYLKTAGSTKVGDSLTLSCGKHSTVLHAEEVLMEGLFNPQTLDGNIVVDDILVSTYTQTVHPMIAHALLAPFRFLYKCGWSPLGNYFQKTSHGLDLLIPRGASVY